LDRQFDSASNDTSYMHFDIYLTCPLKFEQIRPGTIMI